MPSVVSGHMVINRGQGVWSDIVSIRYNACIIGDSM